jgi:membrane-associated phospholipid phosphatase
MRTHPRAWQIAVLATALMAGAGRAGAAPADGNYYRLPAIDWTDGAPAAVLAVAPAAVADADSPGPLDPDRIETSPWRVTPQNARPPEVHHTGLSALVHSTGADFKAFPQRTSTWVILAIGGGAAAVAYPFDKDLAEELAESPARKYFAPGRVLGYGWVQAGFAIGTYAWGRATFKPGEGRTNKISHLGFDLLRANILTSALTYGIKISVQRDRPTGECCSFPSGHASLTFATASVLERHFGYRAAWPTFVIAGYVAASRLFDNRHYLSDVLFGSALGIASGWTVVGRHGRDQFALLPVPTKGGMAVMVQWRPPQPAASGSH